MPIQIPPGVVTGTHCTCGLPGYPALDMGGFAGEAVLSPSAGQVSNVHYIPWGVQIGGWTLYFLTPDCTYFVTHLEKAIAPARVAGGTVIGWVADPAAHGGGWTYIHTHVGCTCWIAPPGGRCCEHEPARVERPPAAQRGRHIRQRSEPATPRGDLVEETNVLTAWGHLSFVLSRSVPTQLRRAKRARAKFGKALR